LKSAESISASITLTQEDKEGAKPASIGFYIIRGDLTKGRKVLVMNGDDDVVAKAKFTTSKAGALFNS